MYEVSSAYFTFELNQHITRETLVQKFLHSNFLSCRAKKIVSKKQALKIKQMDQ